MPSHINYQTYPIICLALFLIVSSYVPYYIAHCMLIICPMIEGVGIRKSSGQNAKSLAMTRTALEMLITGYASHPRQSQLVGAKTQYIDTAWACVF